MKNLRKVLTPFAPDQSGAVSVLYKLGGIIVIIDAGGCTGNICGFDEPRWAAKKSAIFSAGLRDMDAIMGRDDKLADKISDAASKIKAEFIAVIGTPVPAVIATDYQALARMTEKKCGLRTLAIATNGMELYDRGQEKALYAVYDAFANEKFSSIPGENNILGATPSDFGNLCTPLTLEDIKKAAAAEINYVVSPAALKTAKLLKERFNTPYKICCPDELSPLPLDSYENKNILIVHQHVIARALKIQAESRGARTVTLATWFMRCDEILDDECVFLKEEDDFTALVSSGRFDIIIADETLRPLAENFTGEWIDYPHFALSGRL